MVDLTVCPDWLRDGHRGAWLQLRFLLDCDGGFALIMMICEDSAYQQKIIEHLEQDFPKQRIVDVSLGADDTAFMADLFEQGAIKQYVAVHLIGTQHWLREKQHINPVRRINYQRERIASCLQQPLMLWLTDAQTTAFAHEAPDAWAWRAAVLDFTGPVPQVEGIHHHVVDFVSDKDAAKRRVRIQGINDYLAGKDSPSTADIALLLEQARLHEGLGELDQSMHTANEALKLSRQWNDQRHAAMAHGQIADVLQTRGDLNKALKIHKEEELPIYEKLGDVYAHTVSLGRIADIYQVNGDLNEAFRIRMQEQLPVYEKLGEVRARAVTMGKIADILESKGSLDEALKIRMEEEIPVFKKLGDTHEYTVSMAKIADVFQARGDLDEALLLLNDKVLPSFKDLGDVRSHAVAMGKIANILQARGSFDEALRIRQEEELPVYEELGDMRSLLIGRANLAILMDQQDGVKHRTDIERLLRWSLAAAVRMQLPENENIAATMQQFDLPIPDQASMQTMVKNLTVKLFDGEK